jgi:purine-nucleoside phosphorylase
MSDTSAFATLADAARRQPPGIALVLGSGMSELAQHVERLESVSYVYVPGMSPTTVPGHTGCLTLGTWSGQRLLLFEGRLHFYEGQPWRSVLTPVHIARELGARILLVTNASGGIREDLAKGSLLIIADHFDWTRPYAWRQPGPGGLAGARPSPYSPHLIELLREAGTRRGIELPVGTYAQLTGPCYETPAEIRALKALGADAVGMSTAREIQAGFDLGMECAALSCITNRAAGLSDGLIHHEDVLLTMAAQTERLAGLLASFLQLQGVVGSVEDNCMKGSAP